MKNEIGWHKNNLIRNKLFLEKLEREETEIQSKIRKAKIDIALRELQIETAEKKGKTAFDNNRFCIKKGK